MHSHRPDISAATPQFFQSTKFFAVLDVDEARELFAATTKVCSAVQRSCTECAKHCILTFSISVLLTPCYSVPLLPMDTQVTLAPHQTLFRAKDSSEPGIFIVVRGQLGVFVPVGPGGPLVHTNTLQ